MASNESTAYDIMRLLDVDYVLIVFGGAIGYASDDINKFLWMVRIAEGEHPRDVRVSRADSLVGGIDIFTFAFNLGCQSVVTSVFVSVVRRAISSRRRESSGWIKPRLRRCSTV